MNKPEAGSAVAVTIINSNGTPETFKLALARENGYFKRMKYLFINDSGDFYDGGYSGGVTGVGLSDRHNLSDDSFYSYTILATDLAEINKIVDEENARIETERAQREKEREEKEALVREALKVNEPRTIYESDKYLISAIPTYYTRCRSGPRKFTVNFYMTNKALLAGDDSDRPSSSWPIKLITSWLVTPTGRASKKARTMFGDEAKALVAAIQSSKEEISNAYIMLTITSN